MLGCYALVGARRAKASKRLPYRHVLSAYIHIVPRQNTSSSGGAVFGCTTLR